MFDDSYYLSLDGALTGLSKKMIRQIYGDDQFKKWRRGFNTPPPEISSFSHYCKSLFPPLLLVYDLQHTFIDIDPGNDSRYVNYVKDIEISFYESLIRSLAHGKIELHRKFPKAESLKDCMDRTLPYFLNTIQPEAIMSGKNVLIASSE